MKLFVIHTTMNTIYIYTSCFGFVVFIVKIVVYYIHK